MQGTYALVIQIPQPLRVRVGRLGDIVLPEGYWLYFGSALNGLEARLRRHLRHDKKLHWHVDYLTAKSPVVQVWYAEGAERRECDWTVAALDCPGVTVPVPGFGSSDCRNCPAHLARVDGKTRPSAVLRRLVDCAREGEQVSHWPDDPAGIGLRVQDVPFLNPGLPLTRRLV